MKLAFTCSSSALPCVLALVGVVAITPSSSAVPLVTTSSACLLPQGVPGRIYVDANMPAPGTGANWPTAYKLLETAVAAAAPGDTLWIADGQYTVPAPANTFLITKSLKLYGGFKGYGGPGSPGEGSLSERTGLFYETVLDGASNGSVVSIIPPTGTFSVLIDGFQIKDGAANNGAAGNDGGGIYCKSSNLDLANLFVVNCFAGNDGGGLFFEGASAESANTLNMKLCEFRGNQVGHHGGAIFGALLTTGDVVNTVFDSNSSLAGSGGSGGGVFLWKMGANNTLWFTNCIFFGNTVYDQGAFGGGMVLGHVSAPAPGDAGHAMIVNCTFANNGAFNCNNAGQALSVSVNSLCEIYNSILYFNTYPGCTTPSQIRGTAVIHYSDVQYSQLGGDVINLDPRFRSLTSPSGLRLMGGEAGSPISPCLDYGDYTKLPYDNLDVNGDGITNQIMSVDFKVTGRVENWPAAFPDMGFPTSNPWLDMGAYEKHP